jgi:hypothetical protein
VQKLAKTSDQPFYEYLTLAIAERLAKSDPGNAGWQRDLALSWGRLGGLHKQSGDTAKARDSFRQGQAIMQQLTKLSPDNAVWKQDLAWFDGQIAELDRNTARTRPSPRQSKERQRSEAEAKAKAAAEALIRAHRQKQ